jgi:hypothetical protein
LIGLFIDKQITQEEYQKTKAKLVNQKKKLQERTGSAENASDGWLEPHLERQEAFILLVRAVLNCYQNCLRKKLAGPMGFEPTVT